MGTVIKRHKANYFNNGGFSWNKNLTLEFPQYDKAYEIEWKLRTMDGSHEPGADYNFNTYMSDIIINGEVILTNCGLGTFEYTVVLPDKK